MSELVAFTHAGTTFDIYIARPTGAGPHPTVLVFHAFGGRDEFAEKQARRLTELGYLAGAVDLYGLGVRGKDRDSSSQLMDNLLNDPSELRGRIAAAVDAALRVEGVDATRVGAIGFCFGGLCAILGARMGLNLRGVASFHGLLKLLEPLDAKPKARLLVLHGQDDPMVPAEDVAQFSKEMQRIEADWQLHAYSGVVHSFTNPAAQDAELGTVYDPEAQRRSWRAMERFFADVM